MDDEPFEILDVDGCALGVAPRSRVHREGLWHRAASVFLFRSDGRLVIQRRQWTKDVCPGVWDLSVAEHLKPGESYEQAAARGLREELGVGGVRLMPLGAVVRAKLELPEQGVRDYELQQAFRGVFDGELRPDSAEVYELEAIALAELGPAFAVRPNDFTPWFRASAIRLGLCKSQSPL
jgi:isopentenyl-diphosphate delta-isomerase